MVTCSDSWGAEPGTELGTAGPEADSHPSSTNPAGNSPPGLPLAFVGDIAGVPEEKRWLIDQIWSASGVGILGGTPKTGKTWFGLECAVGVASGTPVLGRFEVQDPGTVLVYPAEDDPRTVRDRIAGLCAHRRVCVRSLPLAVITCERLAVDTERDRESLEATIERYRPKLLLLDPLVRLHSGDENYAGHVSEILGYLRTLQRRFDLAIMVTHHVSKRRGSKAQLGQGLRGSGDLHAWGDSNAYLTKEQGQPSILTLEHRAAEAPPPMALALVSNGGGEGVRLELVEHEALAEAALPTKTITPARAPREPLPEQVLALLGQVEEPVSQVMLRRALGVRNQTLTKALHELAALGRIERVGKAKGWRVLPMPEPVPEGDVG